MNIGQWVCLSVDDVIGCFKWIYENCPDSIFDEPMLGKLKEWHEAYNLDCDLYVYEIMEEFSLADLQDQYWQELGEVSDWLKLGWHRRKGGPLTDDIETELDSLQRVYDLIVKKSGENSWTRKLRLHRWEAEDRLLQSLSEKGITTLLTADSDILSYDLKQEDMTDLNEKGFVNKDLFMYLTTDVRLDYLSEEKTVAQYIEKTEEVLYAKPWKPELEIFLHEWVFHKIVTKADQYWEQFTTIRLQLYINVSVLLDRYLYFTACNTNYLYKRDVITGAIEPLVELPCTTHNSMKFAALVAYENRIWMIPRSEQYIYIYDIETKRIYLLDIPFEFDRQIYHLFFSKPVQDGKYLWLLPYKEKAIFRIDMDKQSIKSYRNWPAHVSFDDKKAMNFKNVSSNDKYLYLFRDGCSHNIRMDMTTGTMTIWDMPFAERFGTVAGEYCILSPVHSGDKVEVYSLQCGKMIKELELPERIWMQEELYSYWYVYSYNHFIYIMPYEAKSLLILDLERQHIITLKLNSDYYKTLRFSGKSEFIGYELMEVKDEIWITPFMGNEIHILNKQNKIEKIIAFYIPISSINRNSIHRGIVRENRNAGITALLSALKEYDTVQWTWENTVDDSGCRSIGETIYEKL